MFIFKALKGHFLKRWKKQHGISWPSKSWRDEGTLPAERHDTSSRSFNQESWKTTSRSLQKQTVWKNSQGCNLSNSLMLTLFKKLRVDSWIFVSHCFYMFLSSFFRSTNMDLEHLQDWVVPPVAVNTPHPPRAASTLPVTKPDCLVYAE